MSLRRFGRALAALLVLVTLLAPSAASAASDPALAWYTIETPHFRVTYHSGCEEVAQHVASIAEDIYGTMTVHVGWVPGKKTEILLQDFSESANGSATPLPYNALRLLVTAPEDLSPLGDVDDWYLELVTHEYTHILHTDNIRGIPAIVNAVVGKTLAPNQIQPRWILEGLAVYHESARTSAGRMRNSMWDMYMRTDVLEDNVASIDQISSSVRRWPQGNLWYVYGSYFTQWIAETFGEEALRKTASDYGMQPIPWGFNRSMRRATGSTYVEMYPAWVESMKRRYGAQAAAVRKKGLRVGVRLTHHGQSARYPRWIPKGAWAGFEGGLLYFREDQHQRPGLWALPLRRDARGVVVAADEESAEHIARTSGESYPSFLPDGGVVFNSQAIYKNVFLYGDLERLAPGARSSFGTPDGGRTTLTGPIRAASPAVSPDGRRVVFTKNRAGTRTIHIADLRDDHIEHARPLVATAQLEQAFTPRWSPDGTHVAYSVWKRGGYRDIRYVDVRDGSYRDLTVDRAVDGGPSFSADGKLLYFHSDRTGISNVYAWDLETERLWQVTNVLTGAYSPAPSPDGKSLAYVGYTKAGFDLFMIPIDRSTWTEAEPYVDDKPTPPKIVDKRWPVKPYSPWATIWPRKYSVQITGGSFGEAVTASVSQSDISGFHTVIASTTVELAKPYVQGSVGYVYSRLPFDASVSAFRTITPRVGFKAGSYEPTVIQENLGFAETIAFALPSPYQTQSFVVTHSVSRVGVDVPLPARVLDPYETPQLPVGGLASTLHLGYAFTNAERYLWSVGPERGYSLSAAIDLTHPSIGSDYSGFVTNADLTMYFLMPWLRHHSLALHAGTGTSGGAFPGRGAFYVGSFVDLPLVDTIRNVLIQGGITLRGYPSVALAGRSYALGNAEYRFPIVNVDRGLSTLPILLNRINGAVFVDYGSAFDDIQAAQFKTGVGGELWFDSQLGYVAPFTFRLGFARGLASGGTNKVYVVAAVPY